MSSIALSKGIFNSFRILHECYTNLISIHFILIMNHRHEREKRELEKKHSQELNSYLQKSHLNNVSHNWNEGLQLGRPKTLNSAQELSQQSKSESTPTSPKSGAGIANRSNTLNDELMMQLVQGLSSPKGKNMKASVSPIHIEHKITLNQIKEEQDKKRATSPLPAMASPLPMRRTASNSTVNSFSPHFASPSQTPTNIFNFTGGPFAHSFSNPVNQSIPQLSSTTANSCFQTTSGPYYSSKLSNTNTNSKTKSPNK